MFGYPLNPITVIWVISALAAAGVIIHPFSWPEAIWAVLGVGVLLALHLIGLDTVRTGVLNGVDVYLFLFGMMALAETARQEGLFDWLAALATKRAAGSPQRLFLLIFAVGTIVTIFLSNDATAVVLTPAVAAAVQTAKVKNPLPYLFICALIANAASFVLPISNPANLVIYGAKMPPLLEWLPRFAIPSVLSILATYIVLRLTQWRAVSKETLSENVEPPKLSGTGKLAAAGIALTAHAPRLLWFRSTAWTTDCELRRVNGGRRSYLEPGGAMGDAEVDPDFGTGG
jgi:arsenical pump membrane protein